VFVPRIRYPAEADIFVGTTHCKARQGALKYGIKDVVAPKEDQEWGRRYVRICLAGGTPPKTRTIITQDAIEIKPQITADLKEGPDFPREPLIGHKFQTKEDVETALAAFDVPDIDVPLPAAAPAAPSDGIFNLPAVAVPAADNNEGDPFGHGGNLDE
jgi:hypothetical protein